MVRIKLVLLIICMFIFSMGTSQTPLKFPNYKPNLYDNPSYYYDWKKAEQNVTKKILEHDNDISLNYWNRYINYWLYVDLSG